MRKKISGDDTYQTPRRTKGHLKYSEAPSGSNSDRFSRRPHDVPDRNMAGQRYHPKYSRKSLTPKSEGHSVPVQNGQRKHREFEYPNIERVKITADGVPGAIYNYGIPKDKLFLEAKMLFGDRGVTESTFYLGSQFGLVIDLRTTSEKNLFGNGKEMSKKKESQISIKIKKKPTESNVTCHVFLVSCFPGVEGADLEGIFV